MSANANQKLTPAQRALLFAQMTRQHWQALPPIAGAENSVVSFTIPKVRLLSKIRLLVTATLNAQHASNTSYTPAVFAPFSLLRNVKVDLNIGFTPFNIGGKELYFYNLLRDEGSVIQPLIDTASAVAQSRRRNVLGKTAAPDPGTDNPLRLVVDLPLTLNDRDPVGLLLAQNEETTITVEVAFGNVNDVAPASTGYTFALSNIVVQPFVETFSIPAVREALPDLGTIKIVNMVKETIPGAGEKTVKLLRGLTYRKLLIFIEDGSGGEADGDLPGDIEIVLNQTDTPYRVPPRILAAINQEQYGFELPQGLFVFDFSYQGLANYGGSRDYIDTERLTEFWVRFQAVAAGNVTIVAEQLAQLRQQ